MRALPTASVRCRARTTEPPQRSTSEALGAVRPSSAPMPMPPMVELNKQAGLSHGKVSRALDSLFGISLTPGGSAHTVLCAARRCEPVYAAICRPSGNPTE